MPTDDADPGCQEENEKSEEVMSLSENTETFHVETNQKSNWWFCGMPEGDRGNILLLIFMYSLQGIPLGLIRAVPLLLMSRHVTYSQQGTFAFASWPFSLKLFWAPIVDSIYIAKLGKRKCWLIPTQYVMGICMIVISFGVNEWLGEEVSVTQSFNYTNFNMSHVRNVTNPSSGGINIVALTISFFVLNFFAATQDIVVDGWALTLLRRENIGWASSCNTIGQEIGQSIAYVFFLTLESKDFANKWLRTVPLPYGVISARQFLLCWSVIVILGNTLIWIFKKEVNTVDDHVGNHKIQSGTSIDVITTPDKPDTHVAHCLPCDQVEMEMKDSESDESEKLSLWKAYFMLWKIVCLKPVQLYVLIMFAVELGQSPHVQLTNLKLGERGVARETLALVSLLSLPSRAILPFVLRRWITGPRPLTINLRVELPRTLHGILNILFVYFTPRMRQLDGTFPAYFYILLCLLVAVDQVSLCIKMACHMAFRARISDPIIGGTYMTFLNTMANMSHLLTGLFIIFLVDPFSKKTCISGFYQNSSCLGTAAYKQCVATNGECSIIVEGYYILVSVGVILGIGLVLLSYRPIRRLEKLSLSAWLVISKPKSATDNSTELHQFNK